MLKSTQHMLQHQLDQHIIRDNDIAYLFPGTPAKRYALVNKALNKGELIQICRGFYILKDEFRDTKTSAFYLANRIAAHSFISAESALSYHSWIPESVQHITCIAPFGRNRDYKTPFGDFLYLTPPVKPQQHYLGVHSEKINNQFIYIASPLRATLDYLYWHRIRHADFDFLAQNLRIDTDNLLNIKLAELHALSNIYQISYIQNFINTLMKRLSNG